MCGIAGAFSLDGDAAAPLADEVLREMTARIAYRGPDDAGFVTGDGCSLGARRLSIIDVEGGHQPFANESGRVWAAQNGEIYNHADLRSALEARGHVLRSRCDTEVLPHLYEEHGPALCDSLRGMFAFAVWDREERRGVLVRDRLGIKPLFYAIVDGMVVFGSELKAVVASGAIPADLDVDAIAAYLALGYVPGPMTPLKAVRKLEPGHRLVVADGRASIERWWEHPVPEPDHSLSEAQWRDALLDKLDESVRLRLMSDVPLGAMLSGGLDSSLIVGLMRRHMDQPVKTFSVGFGGTDSELDDARRVAAHNGADHHGLEVSLGAGADDLSRLAWHLDEPLADLSALGFLALSELAVQHVTVALSGQGADELFGGYRKHRVASLAQTWGRAPASARAAGAAALRRGPGRSGRLVDALQAPDAAARLLATSMLVRPDLREDVFGGALAEHADAGERVLRGHLAAIPGARPLEAALYLDARLGLVDDMLAYFDRASMACSLEVRVPFLDHELVELAARIPSELKVRRLQGKYLLREASRDLVPPFVLEKRKRGFFNEAVGTWLAAGDGAVLDSVLLAPEPAHAAVVDPEVVRRAVREFKGGRTDRAPFLLSLVMLELWLRDVLPAMFAAAPRTVRRRADMTALRYAVVTPVRDEERNLPRLAAALAAQTVPPAQWVVVDDGSTDGTAGHLEELSARHPWLRCVDRAEVAAGGALASGRRDGRALETFRAGLAHVDAPVDVVIKMDADIDFDADYVERILDHFDAEPDLGLTSGTCYEREGGRWVRRTKAASTVWGASRAYRWDCVDELAHLEPRMGWDGLDELRLQLRGYRTETLLDAPFRHHRREGGRERSSLHHDAARGRASWYMGYRLSFLAMRALYRSLRQPTAVAMIYGYAAAAVAGAPQYPDARVRTLLRDRQRLRNVLRHGAPRS